MIQTLEDTCTQSRSLAWDQTSAMGLSAKELADMAVGDVVIQDYYTPTNADGDPILLRLPEPFDPAGKMTLGIEVEPGDVESRYGEDCVRRLTIKGKARLRSSEGLLDESFEIEISADEPGAFHVAHRFDNFNAFAGSLSQTHPSIPELEVEEIEFGAWVKPKERCVSGSLEVTLEPVEEGVEGSEVELLVFPKSKPEEEDDE